MINNIQLLRSVKLLIVNYLIFINVCLSIKAIEFDALMPNVSPQNKDTYLCHQLKLNDKNPFFITEFQPKSSKQIAHHILLFGCNEKSNEDLWDCGEMSSKNKHKQYKHGPVCKGKQSIIYAWAMDAPELILPKDVAFKVGGDTDIKYLVLQVHYADVEQFKGFKINYFIYLIKLIIYFLL